MSKRIIEDIVILIVLIAVSTTTFMLGQAQGSSKTIKCNEVKARLV